jgi:Flp pilus assembly secretin CpaC/tetratricopeptide (TPR) repeat protein
VVFFHRFTCITVLVALLAGLTTSTFGQDADSDRAKALLKQGITQFDSRNYQQAKATLLKAAEVKALTGGDKTTLDDYLVRVDPAIRKQRAASEAYRAGQKALKAGDLADAKKQFTVATTSNFLRQEEIKDAKAELAVVDYKIKAAAAAKPAPVAAVTPKPAAVVEPVVVAVAPKPVAVVEAKPVVAVTPKPAAVVEPIVVAVAPKPVTVVEAKPVVAVTPKPAAVVEPVVVTVAPKPVAVVEPVVVTVAPKPVAVVETKPEVIVTPKPAPVIEPVVVAVAPKPVTVVEPVVVTVAPKPVAVVKAEPVVTVAPKPVVTVTPKVAPQSNLLAGAAARRKKAAAEHLAAGKSMLDGGDSVGAAGQLQNAVSLDPGLVEAQKLLALARKLNASSGGGGVGVLQRLNDRRNVRRGEAAMEYEKSMQRSKELMAGADSESDFNAAVEAAKAAGNVVDTSKSLFTADKYRQMQASVTRQIEWIGTNREKWSKAKTINELKVIEQAKARLIALNAAKRRRRISDLITRARSLEEGRNYAGALEELKQIRILDPENQWANEHRALLQGFAMLEDEKTLNKDVIQESNTALLDIKRSEIPWHLLVTYPKDWKEITIRRKPFNASSQAETEMDRIVRKQLDTRVSKLDFEDMELSQVFEFLRDVSGANIHVKWRALALESIEPATTVNVHLSSVTFRKALDTILEDVATGGEPGVGETGLGYVIDEGVITISTKADLGKQTVVRVYDIRDMIVRVPMFEGPRLGRSTKGAGDDSSDSSGLFDPSAGGGSDTGTGLEGDLKSRSEIITEIKTLVTDTVDRDSWRDAGGEAGAISEIGGQLVITQTIENHESIVELIGKLREARALEVNIEARFITVSSGFLNRVGIDLDFYFNLGSKFSPPAGSGHPAVNGSATRTMMGATQNSSTLALPAFTNTIGAGGTGIGAALGGAAATPAFSFGGSFLDDVQVSFLIEATQAHDSTRMLTAPRITLFNGQRAYISLSTEETYVSGTESQVGDNSNAQDVETDTVTSGTVLDVEATVSADRRYVTMTIRPQVSTADLTNQVNINQNATVDPITGAFTEEPIFITLPIITTRDLQTTVSVPDGGTLLLGGQKESITVERELGVPVLSKVPFLRRLFTNTGDNRDESTLMIMVRPSIIIQSEKELEVN